MTQRGAQEDDQGVWLLALRLRSSVSGTHRLQSTEVQKCEGPGETRSCEGGLGCAEGRGEEALWTGRGPGYVLTLEVYAGFSDHTCRG